MNKDFSRLISDIGIKKFEMNMKTESILYSKNLILRDATENDSEFILKP